MVGREKEIARLNQIYDSDESEFVAVYGRRRVGKTYLVREVFANRILFMHTGRANAAMKQQLAAFRASLQEQGLANCPPLGSWLEAFQELKRPINSSDGFLEPVGLREEGYCPRGVRLGHFVDHQQGASQSRRPAQPRYGADTP